MTPEHVIHCHVDPAPLQIDASEAFKVFEAD